MKKNNIFTTALYMNMSLAALVAMSSCSNDLNSGTLADNTTKLSLNAAIEADTRVSVSDYTVKWAKNDVIYVNSHDNEFTTSTAGASTTFEGSITIDTPQSLYAVFDAETRGAFSSDGKSYTLPQHVKPAFNFTSAGATNTATLGKYLFLYGVTGEVTSESTSIDVNMKHGMSVQDITFTNIDFSEGNYITSIELISDEPFLDEITYNIATGEYTPGASTITSIPLTVSSSNVSSEAAIATVNALTELTLRMPILPQTIASTATWTITATLADGGEYTYTFPDATKDFTFVAGTCHDLTVDFSKMSYVEPIVELDVITFSADDVEGKDVWYFNNSSLAAGDVDNLNTILAAMDNPEDITVTFTELKTITASVFAATNIVNAEFPNVTTISGASIFASSKIQRLTMPNPTSNLGANAFEYCTDLVAINAPDGEDGIYLDGVIKLNNYSFRGCTSITKASFASAASAVNYVFDGCTNLESISLGSATSTGNYIFQNCTSLKSVYAPKLTTFGSNTFRTCESLETFNATDEHPGINLEGISSTADYTFRDCASITEIYAPDLTYLGAQIFAGLASLQTLEVATNSTITSVTAGASVFLVTGTSSTIYTTPTATVNLTTGANNGTTVNGNVWSVVKDSDAASTFSYTLGSITTK